MRLSLRMKLETNYLPIEYRKMFASYLKRALSEYADGKYFNDFYGENHSQKKDLSWSVSLYQPKFLKNHIELSGNDLVFTVVQPGNEFLVLFNSMLNQKDKPFPVSQENQMTLEKVTLVKEKKVTGNVMQAKMYSPICLRLHEREGNQDRYVTAEDEDFTEHLKDNLMRNFPDLNQEIQELRLDKSKLKRTVIPLYGQKIQVSIGEILLMGSPELLQTMISSSIGSRKALGFGVMSLIDSWRIDL